LNGIPMRRRGEIWLAKLNPRRGTEPGKTRPVLIVQAQPLLDADHPSTVIIPLTTNLIEDAAPLHIRVPAAGKLKHDSDLLVEQVRAIDNARIVQGPLTRVAPALMAKIEEAIAAVLDIGGSFDSR
jgi:mRNA interferase MazF